MVIRTWSRTPHYLLLSESLAGNKGKVCVFVTLTQVVATLGRVLQGSLYGFLLARGNGLTSTMCALQR